MEKLLKIPYNAFNDWNSLQKFLDLRGNPRYELVGDVNLFGRQDIFDLGNLVRVYGHLDLRWSSIESLGVLEYVENYLNLNYRPIESIGNLKYVGGNLYLMYSSIQSLENLEYVGSNVYLSEDHQIPPEQLTKFHIISV